MEEKNNYEQFDSLAAVQGIIKALFLDEELSKDQIDFLKVNYESIQKFLDAPLNSPKDAETKKIFAKVILLAKEKGILPDSLKGVLKEAKPNETEAEKQERIEETAEAIEADVDEGIDRVKTGYKVGIGELNQYDAAEYFIDKAAIRISRIADKLIDKGFDWVINKGSVLVERVFPKLTPVVEVVKRGLVVVKPAVKTIVRTGISTIAKSVKTLGKKVVPKVVTTVKSAGSALRTFFGKFFK